MAGSGTRFRSVGGGGIAGGDPDVDDDLCSRVDDVQLLLLYRTFCEYDVSKLFG